MEAQLLAPSAGQPGSTAPLASRPEPQPQLHPTAAAPEIRQQESTTDQPSRKIYKPRRPPIVPADLDNPSNANIMGNLNLCLPAIHCCLKYESELDCDVLNTKIALEECLLTLAAYPNCTAGLVYIDITQVDSVPMITYLESGCYQGYINRQTIASLIGKEVDSCLFMEIFTKDDINNKTHLFNIKPVTQNCLDKRIRHDKLYKQNLFENKAKSVEACLKKLQTSSEPNLTGRIVHVAVNGFQHHLGKQTNTNDW